MNQVQELEHRYYMFAARRQPVVIVRGRGTKVWDQEGKEYLDFTAGWAVCNLGHCHPAVTEAIRHQAETLLQTSNAYYTLPQLELAQLLIDHSCLDKVFLCNSGAEANEGAVKLARKYGKLQKKGAYQVITAYNSFHGRTLTMTAATGQPHYQEPYTPLTPGFVHVEFNDMEAIKRATSPDTVAVMLEPVQGEGGVHVASTEYLRQVRQWCDDQGLLLIFDEVQTGMGRLGSLFGYQRFGVEPDVMTLAKALGNGVPIGAILTKERCNVFQPGDHGSTFGGNALASAAAAAATRYIIEHRVWENAAAMGDRLKAGLEALGVRHEMVRQVRGMGLLLAMEFHDTLAGEVVATCNREGLLLNAVRPNAIRLMPPLTITAKEVDEGLAILERVLASLR